MSRTRSDLTFSEGEPKKGMITRLRKLGGVWKAYRTGFSTYRYEGDLNGHHYELRSYAHFTPRYDGDDDTFTVMWHIRKDGEPLGSPTTHPVSFLKFLDQ